ncbi:MAG: protein translocase subunit SecF [Acidimicrobiales bacterium]|jgi:preprotein translocase subunit SecF|nr:protein translocase subunit SecF [Acidimicrobiales bacterium]
MNGLTRLYRGESTFDFVTWWRRALVVSAVLVVLSVTSLFVRGLNLGIDFEGGVSWEVPAPGVSVEEARSALTDVGLAGAKIQIVGGDVLRVQGPNEDEDVTRQVTVTISEVAGVPTTEVSVSTVGASWGSDITEASVRALVLFFAAILLYLTIRLEWRMAVAAIVAVAHDVIISVGVYSIFQWEVTPATVIAFLTILGYSIYDTIVVDDKIKENERFVGLTGRMTYTQMVNRSMNQVLLRSINTTVVALLPVISLLVVGAWMLGAVTLQEFSLALLVGLTAGAYSSIYVAAPILVWLKEKEPKNRSVRERLEASGGGVSATDAEAMAALSRGLRATPSSKAAAAAERPSASGPGSDDGTPSVPAGAAPSGAIPPRPRKKSKKR